jgi:hypothetical protein
VETLHVDPELVDELSRSSLQPEDGEFPLELLPELHELTILRAVNAFASFIDPLMNVFNSFTWSYTFYTPPPFKFGLSPRFLLL